MRTLPFLYAFCFLFIFGNAYSQCVSGISGGTLTPAFNGSGAFVSATNSELMPDRYFSFTATAGRLYSFRTTGGSNWANPYLTLTNNANGVILVNDDNGPYYTDNCSGGELFSSFDWVASASGTYRVHLYRNGCQGYFATPNSAVLQYREVTPPAIVFGSNTWRVYAFNGTDRNLTASQAPFGYYEDNNVSINSTNRWANTPSEATTTGNGVGWTGAPEVPVDNHTVVYKRQGFPCGYYEIDVDNHDDDARLYINNILVWDQTGCCADRGVIWSGVLDATTTVEFRVQEGCGGSVLNAQLNKLDSWSVSANASPTALCQGANISLTSSQSGTTPQFRNTVDVGIPDNICVNSYINVTSALNANQITSVILNANHTWVGDLEIRLYAPNGSMTIIADNVGGSGDNFTNTNFVTGATALTSGSAPFNGSFAPSQPFSNLTGVANGMWRLEICDQAGGDVGTLLDWQINFPTTYSWTGPNSYTNATQNPTISNAQPAASGAYTATITAGGCSQQSTTAAVTVRPTPTASISGTTTVCQNAPTPNITFTNPQTLPITITYNINGVGSNNINVAASSSAVISAPTGIAGPFTYNLMSVAYQTAPNCASAVSGSATVTVNTTPTPVTVNTSGTYCNSTTLTTSGGVGGTVFFQGTTSGGTSTAVPAASQLITSSGTYYFRAQGGPGCWSTEGSANVTIQPLLTFYADADGDGFGDPSVSTSACTAPPGYVSNNTDCNDANNTVYPGAPEICDGLDNNCNGPIDEGVQNTYYADADNDGFGNPGVTILACSVPPGYVTNNTDCNDANNTVYPGAPEICDGLDNNCNGSTDEGVLNTYYADADGDGLGDPNVSVQACSQPVGYVTNNTDCDDNNSNIYPVAITQNITVYLDALGTASVTPAQVDNGSSAACGIASMELFPNSFSCADIGPNNASLTVKDVNGDSAVAAVVITILDTLSPTVAVQNLTVQLDAFGNASITAAQVNNGSTDNCGIASMLLSQTNFNCHDVGNNNVTLTVNDVNGNSASAVAVITVQDITPPNAFAQNIVVQLDNTGNVTVAPSQVNNGSTDFCGIDSFSLSQTNFTCADVGANNVILTVTDVNGNASTAPAIITVQSMTFPPIVADPLNIAINPGQFIVYTASTSLGTLKWYNASNTLVGTGNTYTTPVLQTATTFTVTTEIAGCESPATVLTVTLKPVTTFGGRKAN